MKRNVLAIPLDEVDKHLSPNSRGDIKIVVPEILTDELCRILRARGKVVKPEVPLKGNRWEHSGPNEPNKVCEAIDFTDISLPQYAQGPFAISFANQCATQDEHYHTRHAEIYFSQQRIAAEYRPLEEPKCRSLELLHGGIVLFGPGIIHKVTLDGLTVVIEIPAVAGDKVANNVRYEEIG